MKIEGVPEGWELVRIGKPKAGEVYIGAGGCRVSEGDDLFACYAIVRKIEPSYAERQAAWVKENGLKVGDKVKVLRASRLGEGGWSSAWVPTMNATIGKALPIKDILQDDILIEFSFGPDVDTAFFPYFVLEKLTTRPMTRDEFLAAWRYRGWCPLILPSGDISPFRLSKQAIEVLNGARFVFGTHSEIADICFASDNTTLTITE